MKLYTSYYAQLRHFTPNVVGLSTAIWPPKWRPFGKDANGILVVDCPPLHPGPSCAGLCTGRCAFKKAPDCDFIRAYQKQLEAIDAISFWNSIRILSEKVRQNDHIDDPDFAFLVYEAPTNKCSERIAIQQWVRSQGIEIEEWHRQLTSRKFCAIIG